MSGDDTWPGGRRGGQGGGRGLVLVARARKGTGRMVVVGCLLLQLGTGHAVWRGTKEVSALSSGNACVLVNWVPFKPVHMTLILVHKPKITPLIVGKS